MLKFELNYHFKQTSFQLACLLFLVLGTFAIAKGNFGDGDVYKNSSYVSAYLISLLSLFSIFSSMLFCANVVLRDYQHKIDSVIFTTAVNRFTYVTSRFLGLLIAVFLHLAFAALGLYIGTAFVETAQLGEFNMGYYLHPLFFFGLPNVLLSVSCIFCAALLTKNVRAIYATGVLLYIIYMVASILGDSPLFATSNLRVNDPSILPFLADPFGMTSFFSETKKWTNANKNYQLFPIKGVFLANRLTWLGFSVVITFLSYTFFNFRLSIAKQSKQRVKEEIKQLIVPFKHFKVDPQGIKYNYSTFASQFKLELISLFKHIPFMVMLILWVFVFSVELKDTLFNGAYGIHAYPTTGMIVEEMRSINFALLLLIFYAAELVSREKTANIDGLIYSTPVRNGGMWLAKCLTLGVLVLTLVTLTIGIGIGVQVANGYFKFEVLTYLSLFYYSAFPLLLFVILIIGIQSLTSNKYLGMLLSMVIVFFSIFSSQLGISHFLLRFAAVPDLQFSYFNGFGHYAEAFNWYMLYWLGFASAIGILTIGMWQNATPQTFLSRVKSIPNVLINLKFIFLPAVLVWVGSGVYIYHQTNSIGKYSTKQERLAWQINYEKKYGPFVYLPQPIIKSVSIKVDLLTEQGIYTVNGIYRLKNETNKPITKIWIGLDPSVNTFDISIPNGENQERDDEFNQQFINLKKPLLPNAETTMNFSLKVIRGGFVPFDTENSIVSNGTYIELEKFVPNFGYNPSLAIDDKKSRQKSHLPQKAPGNAVDYRYHLIDFENTISTALDQQVVTVGTLQKSWIANNRHYFTYKTTQPINFMFALSSAHYEIKKERYKGIDLRIYYKKGQEYNLTTMMKAIKETIAYGDQNFGAYTLKQFTLAEIPQYRGAATAYPGVIFSAERLNFLSNYSKSNKINQAYAITAHEVAHQWWANKLDPAYAPGRAMLTETLAKYTEAILIEKHFGKMYLSNYLRLDNQLYFSNRYANEVEQPLTKAIDQAYVYYQKGGLIMYAIKEAIGEKALNAMLRKLIVEHENPNQKATTANFIQLLAKSLPLDQKKFAENSFNQVVNYDMSINVLGCKVLKNGKFKVDIAVKVVANKQGFNQPQTPDMDVDIAFFHTTKPEWNLHTKPSYLKKHRISSLATKLTIFTDKKPKVVAIDPYAYLLDANLEDNMQQLK
ncbi:M1 family aminopeptidase [Pedobacter sp. Du54]|uniref:ABC transporter permease/M1 family aminopeptidase n=1 Tax=Pedobacter anseongensis TaxID=3133439 RepID=UPI0030986B2E